MVLSLEYPLFYMLGCEFEFFAAHPPTVVDVVSVKESIEVMSCVKVRE